VQDLRPTELILLRQAEQLLVGHGAPEEIGQTAGDGEAVELAGRFAEEQELGRDHDRREPDPDGLFERLLFLQPGRDQGEGGLDGRVGHRAA